MNDAPTRAPPIWPGQPKCRFCGQPMDRNTAAARSNICLAPECEAQRTREASDAVNQRDWDRYRDGVRAQAHALAPDLIAAAGAVSKADGDFSISTVPHLDRPVVARPDDDRAVLAEHLDKIIAEAFSGPPPEAITEARRTAEAPEPPIVSAACATCAGYCCRNGRVNYAYLTPATIQTFRHHRSDLGVGQIRDAYLDRLSATVTEDSCYFHGPHGCTLSRGQRADTCNRFYCPQMHHLFVLGRYETATPTVILATDPDGGHAIATFTPETGRRPYAAGADAGAMPKRASEIVEKALEYLPLRSPRITAENRRAPLPRRAVCRWCAIPIDPVRAASSGSCGAAACERQRISEHYRAD